MTKGVERNTYSAKTSALEPQSQLQKSCGGIRRSSRIRNMGQSYRNQDVEPIRIDSIVIDLTRAFEEGEHHGSNKIPDSETTQKKMEEQIGFRVESMEAMKSKIEALEEENAKLREKLDVACAKLEEFENARLACYEALSKVNHTDALWTSSDL